jgi:hypothetical protein
MDFMCLAIIDPSTSWFGIVELPNKGITSIWAKEVTEVIIDKSSACIAHSLNSHGQVATYELLVLALTMRV